MTAPTPSAVSWNGPSVFFRLCSPDSLASATNRSSDFFANKESLVRSSSLVDVPLSMDPPQKLSSCAASSMPQPIHRQTEEHNHHTPARRRRPVQQDHAHDPRRRQNIKQGHNRVSECLVRPVRSRPLPAQHENPRNGQHIKQQGRKNHVI